MSKRSSRRLSARAAPSRAAPSPPAPSPGTAGRPSQRWERGEGAERSERAAPPDNTAERPADATLAALAEALAKGIGRRRKQLANRGAERSEQAAPPAANPGWLLEAMDADQAAAAAIAAAYGLEKLPEDVLAYGRQVAAGLLRN